MNDLPVYGFGPEWEGPRVIIETALEGDRVKGIAMRHGGNVWGVGSQVIIHTIAAEFADGGSPLENVAKYLWQEDRASSWLTRLDEEETVLLDRVHSETTHIEIDGDRVPAAIVQDGKEWVVRANHGGLLITVHGHDYSPLGLRLFRDVQGRMAPPAQRRSTSLIRILRMMSSIEELVRSWAGEEVLVRYEPELDTWIFISIHSTRLGPAGGGTRILSYPQPADGLADGMKLAEAMTRKMAVSGLPFGGGKTVLAVPEIPEGEDRKRLLEAYARAINSLNGTFHTATDVNSTEEDMNFLSTMSRFIHGKGPKYGGFGSSGPPTAIGVFHGIRASVKHAFGSPLLEGRSVLVQGVGGVGERLAELLREDHADLILCDIAEDRVRSVAERLEARTVEPGSEIETECDVLAPCAMGGVISSDTVDRLGCKIVAGSANNQLADAEAAEALRKRGVLYAPDYVINSGGAIHLIGLEVLGWDKEKYEKQLESVGDTLTSIYRVADSEGITTVEASDRIVEERLAAGPS